MVDAERKAKELTLQADKKLRTISGIFGSVFGIGSENTDEAADLYQRAGNNFKIAKNWKAAGDSYCRAAALHIKLDSRHEAASDYVEAGNCYRKVNPAKAVKIYYKGIDIYNDMGKFTISARHHVTIAELYEKEEGGIEKALKSYEQAAEYYGGEENNSAKNKCLQKVAQISAELEQYEKAISIYEGIATGSMNNKLLRYGAKDHFFRAALCRMCVDVQDASNSLNRYEEMFPIFADSRECKLLKSLISACTDSNVEAFSGALEEYERVSRLDTWYTSILSKIRSGISEYDLR